MNEIRTEARESRTEKLLRACEIIKAQDEHQTEIDKLIAEAMRFAYDMGKLAAKSA